MRNALPPLPVSFGTRRYSSSVEMANSTRKAGADGLTPQQRALAIAVAEGTATTAAYRKAYSNSRAADSTAAREARRILKLPYVAAFAEGLRQRALDRHDATVDRVVAELSHIAFANMADYMTMQDGLAYVDFTGLTREQAAAIGELRTEETRTGRGDAARDVTKLTFKLHDKISALEKLGRHLGLFREKIEVTGKDGGAIEVEDVTPMERARRIAFVLASAGKDG